MSLRGADAGATAEIVRRMRRARIGDRRRWQRIEAKLKRSQDLSGDEAGYVATLSRIYGDAGVTVRTRILHTRLSEEDPRPGCLSCGGPSEFYCNQNDAYLCGACVVGHDENEG